MGSPLHSCSRGRALGHQGQVRTERAAVLWFPPSMPPGLQSFLALPKHQNLHFVHYGDTSLSSVRHQRVRLSVMLSAEEVNIMPTVSPHALLCPPCPVRLPSSPSCLLNVPNDTNVTLSHGPALAPYLKLTPTPTSCSLHSLYPGPTWFLPITLTAIYPMSPLFSWFLVSLPHSQWKVMFRKSEACVVFSLFCSPCQDGV